MQCWRSYGGLSCPYCAVWQAVGRAVGQYVGQAVTAAIENMPSVGAPPTGAAQAASWGDLQLLSPALWPEWLLDKAKGWIVDKLDPSAQKNMDRRRQELGAIAKQLDNVVKGCTALPDVDRQNWNVFASTFVPWFNHSTPESNDQRLDEDQAASLQDQLAAWQAEIGRFCDTGMPPIARSTPSLAELGGMALTDVGKFFDYGKSALLVGAGLLLVVVAIVGVDNARKLIVKTLAL